MRKVNIFKKGDHVIGTINNSGKTSEYWDVGYFDEYRQLGEETRYIVCDKDGTKLLPNGFARIKKIPKNRAQWLLTHRNLLKALKKSIWYFVNRPYHELESLEFDVTLDQKL